MRLCSRYLLPIWVAMLLVSCGEPNKTISNQDEEVPPKEDASQSDFPEHDFDDSSSSTGDVPNDEQDQSTAPSVLEGQVFSEVGTPLSGIRIIACNAESCTDCATDDNGSYMLANLINGPWKMEAVDDSGLYMDLLFHQRAEDPLPIIQLPYASTPWEGKEEQTLGVILNPTHLVSLTPVGVRLSVSWQVSEEMDYDIYTVDLATGLLQASGRAHMQPSGELWSAPDSTIFEPATMIFVPAASENED